MDPIWFGFATSGTLIVSWTGNRLHSPDVARTAVSGLVNAPTYTSPVDPAGRSYQRTTQLSQVDATRFAILMKTLI